TRAMERGTPFRWGMGGLYHPAHCPLQRYLWGPLLAQRPGQISWGPQRYVQLQWLSGPIYLCDPFQGPGGGAYRIGRGTRIRCGRGTFQYREGPSLAQGPKNTDGHCLRHGKTIGIPGPDPGEKGGFGKAKRTKRTRSPQIRDSSQQYFPLEERKGYFYHVIKKKVIFSFSYSVLVKES